MEFESFLSAATASNHQRIFSEYTVWNTQQLLVEEEYTKKFAAFNVWEREEGSQAMKKNFHIIAVKSAGL